MWDTSVSSQSLGVEAETQCQAWILNLLGSCPKRKRGKEGMGKERKKVKKERRKEGKIK